MAAFYISFDTIDMPGRIKAVRVQLDEEVIRDMEQQLPINLSEHALYPVLEKYVLANPSRKRTND